MFKKLLYIIFRYPMYLFLDPLICLLVAVMASGSIYPLDMIKNIINKGLRLGNISFFCNIYRNCPLKFIQNSLMTRCFIELSQFLSTLFVLWIFCSRLAKYCRYSARFVAFIRVVPNFALLSKYSSNAFFISSVNKERKGCGGIVLLNIRLIKSWIIN